MSDHLTTGSLFDLSASTGKELSTEEMEHLSQCPECQAELALCRDTEQTLWRLQPRPVSADLKNRIYSRLRQSVPAKRMDFLFYAALVLLAFVSVLSVFGGNLQIPFALPGLRTMDWLEKPLNVTREIISLRPDFYGMLRQYFNMIIDKFQSGSTYPGALSVLLFFFLMDFLVSKRRRPE